MSDMMNVIKAEKGKTREGQGAILDVGWGSSQGNSQEAVLNRKKIGERPHEYEVGNSISDTRTACMKALRQKLGLVCLKISKEAKMAGAP